jgi:hypothetical protein
MMPVEPLGSDTEDLPLEARSAAAELEEVEAEMDRRAEGRVML